MKHCFVLSAILTVVFPAALGAQERVFCTGDDLCAEEVLSVRFGTNAADRLFEIRDLEDGAEIDALVATDVKTENIQGWSLGVRHDPTKLEILSVTTEGLGLPTIFFDTTVIAVAETEGGPAPGFVSAVVLAIFPPPGAVLPIADDVALAHARYRVLGGLDAEIPTKLEFTDDLVPNAGSPATGTHFTIDQVTRTPASVIDGQIYGLAPFVVPQVESIDSSTPSCGSVQINWTAVDGATGYELERTVDGGVTYEQIFVGTETAYADGGLAAGNYGYRVRAVVGDQTGEYTESGESQVFTALETPTDLVCEELALNQFRLSWSYDESLPFPVDFRVLASTSEDFSAAETIAVVSALEATVVVDDAKEFFRVQATAFLEDTNCGPLSSPMSDVVHKDIAVVLGSWPFDLATGLETNLEEGGADALISPTVIAIADRNGNIDSAIQQPLGNGDAVVIEGMSILDSATISFWTILPEGIDGRTVVAEFGDFGGQAGIRLEYDSRSETLALRRFDDSGEIALLSDIPIVPTPWNHLAIGICAEAVQLWVNGTNVAEGTRDFELAAFSSLALGRDGGSYDSLRIHDSCLLREEIIEDLAEGNPTLVVGPGQNQPGDSNEGLEQLVPALQVSMEAFAGEAQITSAKLSVVSDHLADILRLEVVLDSDGDGSAGVEEVVLGGVDSVPAAEVTIDFAEPVSVTPTSGAVNLLALISIMDFDEGTKQYQVSLAAATDVTPVDPILIVGSGAQGGTKTFSGVPPVVPTTTLVKDDSLGAQMFPPGTMDAEVYRFSLRAGSTEDQELRRVVFTSQEGSDISLMQEARLTVDGVPFGNPGIVEGDTVNFSDLGLPLLKNEVAAIALVVDVVELETEEPPADDDTPMEGFALPTPTTPFGGIGLGSPIFSILMLLGFAVLLVALTSRDLRSFAGRCAAVVVVATICLLPAWGCKSSSHGSPVPSEPAPETAGSLQFAIAANSDLEIVGQDTGLAAAIDAAAFPDVGPKHDVLAEKIAANQ